MTPADPRLIEAAPRDWWPCCCLKRNAQGRMTHIKLNAPELAKCRKCGATKAQSEAAGSK